MKFNKIKISLAILLIFYTVGIFGLNSYNQNWFVNLTPFNILLTFLIVIWNENSLKIKKFLFNFLVVFLIGFFIEVIGVKTKVIFGNYQYHEALGLKVWSTPLIIGVNWFLLSYGAMNICQNKINNKFFVPIFSAFLMTFLDYLIEPVAIKLNFWTWENSIIPIQNYIAWFLVSLLIQTFQLNFIKNNDNRISGIVFIIQILFFGILNLTLK